MDDWSTLRRVRWSPRWPDPSRCRRNRVGSAGRAWCSSERNTPKTTLFKSKNRNTTELSTLPKMSDYAYVTLYWDKTISDLITYKCEQLYEVEMSHNSLWTVPTWIITAQHSCSAPGRPDKWVRIRWNRQRFNDYNVETFKWAPTGDSCVDNIHLWRDEFSQRYKSFFVLLITV